MKLFIFIMMAAFTLSLATVRAYAGCDKISTEGVTSGKSVAATQGAEPVQKGQTVISAEQKPLAPSR